MRPVSSGRRLILPNIRSYSHLSFELQNSELKEVVGDLERKLPADHVANYSKRRNMQKLQQQVRVYVITTLCSDKLTDKPVGEDVIAIQVELIRLFVFTDDRFESEGEAVGDVEQSAEEGYETSGHV